MDAIPVRQYIGLPFFFFFEVRNQKGSTVNLILNPYNKELSVLVREKENIQQRSRNNAVRLKKRAESMALKTYPKTISPCEQRGPGQKTTNLLSQSRGQ